MHDGVRAPVVAQPEVEGEVVVRRDEVGRMVGFGRVDVVAARGLQADDGIAETVDAEGETGGGVEPPAGFFEMKGSWSGCPSGGDLFFDVPRECVEVVVVDIEGQEFAAFVVGAVGEPVGRACHDLCHQGGAVGRGRDVWPCVFEQVQYMDRCGRRVEADAIGEAAVFVGVVGEDQRGFLSCGRVAQVGPALASCVTKSIRSPRAW